MFDLSEQVALVTGAARGIGRKIAESFQQSGARVVLADFADWGDQLESVGENLWGIRLDVTDRERVKDVVGQVVDQLGRIDILVNNAGITRDGLLIRMKDEDWEKVVATNLNGVFFVTREVISRSDAPTLRSDRQHRLSGRTDGKSRAGQLCGQQGGSGRIHKGGSKGGGVPEHHRECGRARVH